MKQFSRLIILGIETSCDETAAAILEIRNQKIEIKNNVVSSQVKIHAQYGGVVPEVAARKHAENIISVLEAVLNSKYQNPNFKQIPKSKFQKALEAIDVITVTNGPGLLTSLLVGVEAAKTIAFLTKKPLVPVNHLTAHIYANFIGQVSTLKFQILNLFPAICLVVSGGHTELILMKNFENFQKVGQTLDDAAGECFDKVAKILGLGYPGGPAIAAKAAESKNQNPETRIVLPRPMIKSNDFNFSFSGLKTAVLYKIRNSKFILRHSLPQFCAEVQQAIVDVLVEKTIKAAKKFQAKSIILGGGVAANDSLRELFKLKIKNLKLKINFLVPLKKLCTDNAVMTAMAGYFKLIKIPKREWLKKFDWRKIKVDPNLEVTKQLNN